MGTSPPSKTIILKLGSQPDQGEPVPPYGWVLTLVTRVWISGVGSLASDPHALMKLQRFCKVLLGFEIYHQKV